MRTRTGNPSREAHGQPMRVYDWIAPAGTDPHDAVVAMEAAIPGDWDGDGKADVAIYRPGAGLFYILRSSDGQLMTP